MKSISIAACTFVLLILTSWLMTFRFGLRFGTQDANLSYTAFLLIGGSVVASCASVLPRLFHVRRSVPN